MKKTLIPLTLVAALALFACPASAQTTIFSEGFNSDFSNPYSNQSPYQTFGFQYGLGVPGIVASGNNGLSATEGDSFAATNYNNASTTGATTIAGGMDIALGTVAAAGETYTFSGDFGWRFSNTSGNNEELFIFAAQTGFLFDGVKPGFTAGPSQSWFFDMPESTFEEFSFSYTTGTADIGKSVGLRIRLADQNNIAGSTQLLTDNWQVSVIPEPATYAFLAGILALGGALVRRRRV